jgi:hypothetical protein
MLSVAYYWPIQEVYHPLNFDWNGCSTIANATQNVTLLVSYDKSLPNTTSLLVIIGPSANFTRNESAKIGQFLESSGIVLLADDFGTGNSLLEALNISALFSRKPLADLYYYSKDPDFPVITDFSPSPSTDNLTAIVLDRPSYIEIGNSSSVAKIGSSSPFSFVDIGGRGRPFANETVDSYPVLVTVKIGKGMLLLVADPSMFINDMIGLYDNMRFFQNALKMGDGSVIFDTTHLANAPLTNWRIMLKDGFNSLRLGKSGMYIPLLGVAILMLGFSFQLLRLVRRSRNVAKRQSTFILGFQFGIFNHRMTE